MYTFKVNIDKSLYDDFVSEQSLISIMHESAWAHVKDNWQSTFAGLYKDDKLVATALILIRKLALNINLIYVPRGYLIDYTDTELVKIFTSEIKKYAKEKKAYCVKIDPMFCNTETNVKGEDIPLNFSKDWKVKHKVLLDNGYIHKGFKKDMESYLQPRFNMAVPLIDKKNDFLDIDIIKNKISKTTKNYIGNYHQKRGVYFTYSTDISDIDKFYGIINMTEKRQNITLRNKEYYKKLINSYEGSAVLCFAHVDMDKYMTFLNDELNNPKVVLEDTQRQLEQAENIVNTYGKDIVTSVALIVFPSNKNGLKMMEYLYAGNDTSMLPHLNTNVGLLFDIFSKGLDHGMHYCNLGGVPGTLDDNLYTFKSKFNPVILEFVGEYDLPVRKSIYFLFDKGLKFGKKLFKTARNVIKKVK